MRITTLSLAGLVLAASVACSADDPTRPYVVDVATRLKGRVLLPNDTPAPARIALIVSVPRSSGILFAPSAGLETDARGEFDVTLQGIGPAPRPAPDTLRVTVGAVETLDRGPNIRTVIDTVLITLRPVGQTPVTTTVLLRLPAS